MSNGEKKKLLVLVEGAKTDSILMKKLFNIYQIDAKYEIVSYCTNIYVLYQEMFRDGIDASDDMDLLQILKSREKDIAKKKLFSYKYTDILLVFDFDPQDPQFDVEKIKLMQKYFCESSDMGKLYLNYPMVEAFYHLKSIPDENYLSRTVLLEELKNKKYKLRVQQQTAGCDYRKFATKKEENDVVILQNLSKAYFLVTEDIISWEHIISKINSINLNTVLEKQLFNLKEHGIIFVLCTCIFFIMDYNPKLLLNK